MRNRNFLETFLYVAVVAVLATCGIALCLAAQAHAAAADVVTPDEPGRLGELWKGGQILMAIIGGLYLALYLARARLPWLSVGRRAVYIAAAIGGLGVLVEAGQRGTTPTLGLAMTAVMSAMLIIAKSPADAPTPPPRTPEAGRARLRLLVAIALAAAALGLASCATARRVSGAAVGALVDCMAPDIRARVAQLEPAVRPMLVELAQLEQPDTSALRGLVRNLDDRVKSCAVPTIGAAVAAFFERAPKTHAQQIDPARVRAIVREVADVELGGARFRTPDGPL